MCETAEEGGLLSQFSWKWRMCQLPSQSCVPMGTLPLTPQGAACMPLHGCRVPSGSTLGIGTVEGDVSVFSVVGSFPARQ